MLSTALLPVSSSFCSPALTSPPPHQLKYNKDLHAAAVKVLTNRKVSDGAVRLCVCDLCNSPGSCNTAETAGEWDECGFMCEYGSAFFTACIYCAYRYWVNGVRSGICSETASGWLSFWWTILHGSSVPLGFTTCLKTNSLNTDQFSCCSVNGIIEGPKQINLFIMQIIRWLAGKICALVVILLCSHGIESPHAHKSHLAFHYPPRYGGFAIGARAEPKRGRPWADVTDDQIGGCTRKFCQ